MTRRTKFDLAEAEKKEHILEAYMAAFNMLDETIENTLKDRFYNAPGMEERLEQVRKDILENKVSAYAAAEKLVNEKQ